MTSGSCGASDQAGGGAGGLGDAERPRHTGALTCLGAAATGQGLWGAGQGPGLVSGGLGDAPTLDHSEDGVPATAPPAPHIAPLPLSPSEPAGPDPAGGRRPGERLPLKPWARFDVLVPSRSLLELSWANSKETQEERPHGDAADPSAQCSCVRELKRAQQNFLANPQNCEK